MIGAFPVGSRSVGGAESVARVRPSLGIANSTAEAVGFNVGLGLGRGEAIAQANDIVELVSLALGSASSTANANDVIPIHKPYLITAEMIAASPNIDGLQIRLKVGRADSTINAIDFTAVQQLALGQGQAEASANDVIPTHKPSLVLATADANALDLDGLVIRMNLGRAEAEFEALDAQLNAILDLGLADMDAQALDLDGLNIALNLTQAEMTAAANRFDLALGLGRADSTANALDVIPKTLLDLTPAGMTASAILSTLLIGLKVGRADASMTALDAADIIYIVDQLPDIEVDRTSNSATVIVRNPSNKYESRIFRADDHRGTFSVIASSHDESNNYIDSGLDSSLNYKYKVAFIAVGQKGGVEYIVVGERSTPVYTYGTETL